jgi:hypothetical protein
VAGAGVGIGACLPCCSGVSALQAVWPGVGAAPDREAVGAQVVISKPLHL